MKRPAASSAVVSRVMKRVKTKDTAPETAIRKRLFAAGIRFRVQYKPDHPKLGRASIDIAFPKHKIAVFVDGCFWHACPEHGAVPKANNAWWADKLKSNVARDTRITETLEHSGWRVLRFWSHETPEEVCDHIREALQAERITNLE